MKRQTLKPKSKPLLPIAEIVRTNPAAAAVARMVRTPNNRAGAELYRRIVQALEDEAVEQAGVHRGGRDDGT